MFDVFSSLYFLFLNQIIEFWCLFYMFWCFKKSPLEIAAKHSLLFILSLTCPALSQRECWVHTIIVSKWCDLDYRTSATITLLMFLGQEDLLTLDLREDCHKSGSFRNGWVLCSQRWNQKWQPNVFPKTIFVFGIIRILISNLITSIYLFITLSVT